MHLLARALLKPVSSFAKPDTLLPSGLNAICRPHCPSACDNVFLPILGGGIVVGHHLNGLPPDQEICNDIQNRLGFTGSGRSLDHAELVIEGILHRLKLAGIATKGEN